MATEEGVPVDLYIYDLSNVLVSLLSPDILGRPSAGMWHSAVVVFGREYFYGGAGVSACAPGSTQLGAPRQVERLGTTFVPHQVFVDYLQGLATTTYTAAAHRVLEHDCNRFSDEVAQFLCGARVPKHIVAQPEPEVSQPLRLALGALLDQMLPVTEQVAYANGVRHARRDSPDYLTLNNQIEEARLQSQQLEQRRSTLAEKLARKERRREKKRKKLQRDSDLAPASDDDMAEGVETQGMPEPTRAGPSSRAPDAEGDEPARRVSRDPPILYRDLDGAAEFEGLTRALEDATLSEDERQSLDELQQYLVHGEGSWVLGDNFLDFIGRLLSEEAGAAVRRAALRCLAAAALRDDVSLLLHQDRRQHALLGYAHRVDQLPTPEQHALALFMCNLFEHASSAEWLLYISEWEANGRTLSNIRVTTKVCVHCALSEEPELRDAGTALLYNVATKEVKTVRLAAYRGVRSRLPGHAKCKVFDEVCVELAMAALQLLGAAPAEEHLWRTCSALARLVHHSPDVPQLVAVVGPDPSAYRGTSARVDEQIELIAQKLK